MELLAEVICVSLRERLEQERVYSIHSRFPHGINIEADGRLIFIGNKENEILPYGIMINSGNLDAMHQLFEAPSALWKKESFITDKGALKTNAASDFSNSLPTLLPPPEGVLIPGFQEYESLQTGFGETIGDAKQLSGEKNIKLAKAVRQGINLEAELSKWIGAGPGLTPSGDDYLTGILAADGIYSFACPGFQDSIKKLLSRGYTTDIGANQLICAAEGVFSGSWIGFIKAYGKADEREMKEHTMRILKYGHTSGRDMFAGFLMGLAMAECGALYGK